MAALDLLGHRWMLRALWELRQGPVGFRALIDRCEGVSAAVLRERLVEMLEVGIVEQDAARHYQLTRIGAELLDALAPLNKWSARWARTLGDRSAI
jgi:DNA-binding HxlR family transcriptional regulator